MQLNLPEDVSTELKENEKELRSIFRNCSDVVFRSLNLSEQSGILLVYIEELTDSSKLEQIITASLISRSTDRLAQYPNKRLHSRTGSKDFERQYSDFYER